MTKPVLQLSAVALVGSPATSLRKQCSSALEPRNLFLLVADIYRRISFVPTKVRRFLLKHQGKVSHEVALALAESEFEKYRIVQDKLFESDFDRVIKKFKQ